MQKKKKIDQEVRDRETLKKRGIDPKLFDTFVGIANTMHTETIEACLSDLEGWSGPDIEAFRQALHFVKNGR